MTIENLNKNLENYYNEELNNKKRSHFLIEFLSSFLAFLWERVFFLFSDWVLSSDFSNSSCCFWISLYNGALSEMD